MQSHYVTKDRKKIISECSVSGYHRSYGVYSSCGDHHFECKPGECIKKKWICDGQRDCSNNRDEEMCNVFLQEFDIVRNKRMKGMGKEKWTNVNQNMCSKLCLENKKFKCKSFSYHMRGRFCLLSDTNAGLSGQVINENGWSYHERTSEAIRCTIENGYYGCQNGKCINITNVCDRKMNCDDGSDEKDCNRLGYGVRLVDSKEKHKGRVEVRNYVPFEVLGKWGVICDDKFDLRDANVVCRELGFSLGAAEVLQHSHYPVKDPLFLLDDLECLGNETSLRECSFPGWGKHNCGSEETVGVVCRVTGVECASGQWQCRTSKECISIPYLCDDIPDCDDRSDEDSKLCRSPTQIRLSDGPNATSGRLEVRHHGIWGTVCDDDFNLEAANVVCRLLGFYGPSVVKKNAYFGPGKGPIWLDEVHCGGNETKLEECAYPQWGRNNCKHDEDVGIICNHKEEKQKSSGAKPIASSSSNESPMSKEAKLRQVLMAECSGNPRRKTTTQHYERVVGGTNVAREHVPWQASIRVKSGSGKSVHWCGAIVISQYHILTAGHCLRDYNKAAYFVRVGDYDTEVPDSQEQEFGIDHLYMHSNFSKNVNLNNDIGLVKVKGEIIFSDHVRPACLAPSSDMYRPGTNCTVSGWGSISAQSAGFARTLRRAYVPILEQSICRAPFVYGDSLSESMFCAGQLDGGIDSCQGDSGGPLMCQHEGKEFLFGITSWGHGCGRANKPGVYTNVAYFAEWIQEKIRSSLT
ncbi:hypothetical protein RUM44_005914 [Polyplax serrata]|uniref:Neurotrypsin n=1 Tax=Polyplax serrata TaxID=468196 RepID=A0ABR1AYE9_POLSC